MTFDLAVVILSFKILFGLYLRNSEVQKVYLDVGQQSPAMTFI